MSNTSRSVNLTHTIVENLGIAIVKGKYIPDSTFPENELCSAYNVSRTVLREAVKMLTAKGLMASRPRRGTHVLAESQWNLLDPDVVRWLLERKFSMDLLIEFTEVRIAIEPKAAARAAREADAAAKATILAAIERMVAAQRGDDDPLESDISFHVAVLKASGNRFYANMAQLTEAALRFSIRHTNEYKGVRVGNVEDHRRVADAIVSGDSEEAASQMRQLIQGALDLMRNVEETKPARSRRVTG
jgi:DNA-binding FadR family transcriptional regulator